MGRLMRVAAVSEIPAGQGKTLEVEGKTVAVFNCDGNFYAIDNTCKHEGGPLGEGELEGTVVICPWHGWSYDVTTGVSPDDSSCAVDSHAVKLDGDDVLVEI